MKQTIIALGVLVLLAACRQNADEVKTENDATAAITGKRLFTSHYIYQKRKGIHGYRTTINT